MRIGLLAIVVATSACAPDAPGASDASVEVVHFDDCERCHAREQAEHAGSMHAQAFDDALFQREWETGRRNPWCVGCHGPLARDASDPAVHRGVGCASCHVVDGSIESITASGRAPHPTIARADFGDPTRCGRCHDFDFQHARHGAPERLQRTLDEWRSTHRSERCVDCHMPEGSHRLRGPRDSDLLEHALDVSVEATRTRREIVVLATLRVRGAGHAVPTGDLNRNLVLSAWTDRVRASSGPLARLFDRDEDGDRVEIADQRVLPNVERRIVLRLPHARGAIHWSLVWRAVSPDVVMPSSIPSSMIEAEVASGVIER